MHSQSRSSSAAPASGTSRVARNGSARPRAIPYMSERQTQAYLMARDAVRRVQRTSSLLGAVSQMAAGQRQRAQAERHQSR